MAYGKATRIRDAIQALGSFRLLNDAEATKLLMQGGVVEVPVTWTVTATRSGRPVEVRTRVPVNNHYGERLSLDGRIVLERPWQSHWLLIWGDKRHHEHPETIRRLDLRDDHRNPGGEVWERRTHKHLWTEADGNSVAYTPDDIPHDPATPPVAPDDYRAIFEAFAAEVQVSFGSGYEWTDPTSSMQVASDEAIWEVP